MSIGLFRNSAETESYSAGQTIFSEGDPCNHMYAVIEGKVDIVLGSRLLETVEAGGIFGEMALVSDMNRSATAIAQTDCKVVSVDERRFTYMVQQTPFFALQVMRIMANRLRRETTSAG